MSKILEVFWRFLLLGCTSFGGPAAHLGYFQKTFVQDLKWLEQEAYAQLIALSQFLPGPGSSQVGFAIGLKRAGIAGGIAAFVGFTLPSFLIIYFIATTQFGEGSSGVNGLIHSLKLLAVVIVADATLNMQRSFCKEKRSLCIAILSAAALLILPNIWTQMAVLMGAAVYGVVESRHQSHIENTALNIQKNSTSTVKSILAKPPFILFISLFLILPPLAYISDWVALAASFYQTGSLVFGGGHVVLPLLQQSLEHIDNDRFIAGYAAAQAVPGPMFTLATFLGAELTPNASLIGALVATLSIFLPGLLLVLSLQNTWESLAKQPRVAGAIWGVNAAVVGLLLSALYQPIFISAVQSNIDFAIALIAFFILRQFKPPILLFVLSFIGLGFLL
ncbi:MULTISPECIES: chromate efflux transporter [unclassified Neptuniibacter]|jgi:chromate transporter|uniref:chromate efflux transporter n=1 Tax=unclassified Neptuniibacter TaxID=2630693 RepID=UPI0026E48240|nr:MULTISPECIES: chromate efflux transporter [unclassified Neptuniibacter]MDO6513126.1 chromate efflux transporter [Neptuniibacter sp. 2_MG-2023]MDO6592462.1 chromate efflux transporter [Neptuniibacter sp. 1_MG-2023]